MLLCEISISIAITFNEIVIRKIIIHIESFKFIFLIDIESERYLRNK